MFLAVYCVCFLQRMCLILLVTSLDILLLAFMFDLHQAWNIIMNGAECTYFCL